MSTPTTTTPATAADKPKTQLSIRDQLNNPAMLAQIQRALPGHMTADRMARVALTALTRVPKLAECTQASFFKCLLDLSAWGLEPDGRRAHLIPYGRECTLVLDYKGLVELCYRSGYVKDIHTDVVRQGDTFVYTLGKIQQHTPFAFRLDAEKPETAGDIIAAYCIVQMKDDATHQEVMTKQEIDGIRSRSKAGNSGPWQTDYAEMAKKTVFRRASKWLPLSSEVIEAFDKDADTLPPIQSVSKVESVDVSELFGE
jgi:recombination protein RecT